MTEKALSQAYADDEPAPVKAMPSPAIRDTNTAALAHPQNRLCKGESP